MYSKHQRHCAQCGRPFEAQRPHAKYCGTTCRKRSNRAGPPRIAIAQPPATVEPGDNSLVGAVIAELTEVGRRGSALGVMAVELARRIPTAPDSSAAGLHKELRATMIAALNGAAPAADPLDELKRRRDAKRKG
jgi:hypothetical protein